MLTAPTMLQRFQRVRAHSLAICAPLAVEDHVVQPHPDASPPKWHLGHTTWFFETFVLARFERGYRPFRREFGFLFNSYYNAIGARVERPLRGLCTRPTLAEVHAWREAVDARVTALLESRDDPELERITMLGTQHEQQHTELLLTDIKAILFQEPLFPAYRELAPTAAPAPAHGWRRFAGGECAIGHFGDDFGYDNEGPAHRVLLRPFLLAHEPATCGEFLEFMDDDGYRRPEFWLADGWDNAQRNGWQAPQYWLRRDGRWMRHTLHGLLPVDPHGPLSHVSFYEADAFARWAGARLPTEFEWEHAAREVNAQAHPGMLLGDEVLEPAGAPATGAGPRRMIGDVWEWTASAYLPYPGYRPALGALGEYNGKFMVNQMVLRGGSAFTPADHIRPGYRNFFHPDKRWQLTGLRLAKDA